MKFLLFLKFIYQGFSLPTTSTFVHSLQTSTTPMATHIKVTSLQNFQRKQQTSSDIVLPDQTAASNTLNQHNLPGFYY